MSTYFNGTLVVIPTRNRASLAINAIRSILDQDHDEVSVLVSDNSTNPVEAEQLSQFCRKLKDVRLRYLRAPEPLPMTRHWNWAMEQALQLYDASHVTYLTDRMVFRPGDVKNIANIARSYPGFVISYNHDYIADDALPIRVYQNPWTGKLFEIPSSALLLLTSKAILSPPALPRMLNCVVPRTIITAIRERFGNVFDSISPDFSFCYRCLDQVDTIIYHDKSPLVHYALDRSNGASLSSGVSSPDNVDFLSNLGETALNASSPIPAIRTVGNAIFHEYCVVQRETGSSKFPEIDQDRYLDLLAQEVERIRNPEIRGQMQRILVNQGLGRGSVVRSRILHSVRRLSGLASPRKVLNRLLWLSTTSFGGRIWLLLAEHWNLRPPRHNRFAFHTRERALEYAIRFPPRRTLEPSHLFEVRDFLRPVVR
jgi:glycosyltransferase involved in cell wall biosynthesis